MFTESKAVKEETVKIRQQFKLDSIMIFHAIILLGHEKYKLERLILAECHACGFVNQTRI